MFFSRHDNNPELNSIQKSHAIIEFNTDGTIITANQNFLSLMGYELAEVCGKHHSMFIDPQEAQSQAYKEFWAKLRNGEFDAREYKRFGKDGKEVWIHASYNPVVNGQGHTYKIVKVATDITATKLRSAESEGILKAIHKAQAVIEFNTDGTIITANTNFLNATGYTLQEIQNKHHSMFVDSEYAQSTEYKLFWDNLRQGNYETGVYKRFGKGSKEIWLQADYNPIFDMNGKPLKVIKFATDITAQCLKDADTRAQLSAINKSQAVIEFELDGTIITANDCFLDVMGYSQAEIQGRHHSMFLSPSDAKDPSYELFWKRLRNGEFDARVYKRVTKSGKEVWIQASYNPIFDMNGKPFKVVKFATEITNVIKTADLAEETTQNIQSVAGATEEMLASILEISQNMSLSKEATSNIIKLTTQSETAAAQLATSMHSIEKVTELINSIAGKVNMLALNATIEAARAGAAGKGFAVVAAEVKNLALQTAKATDEIAKEVSSVQIVSSDVSDSVKRVMDAANSVDSYIAGVASAIEEQSVVTKDISANTHSISMVVDDIAKRIRKLSQDSADTSNRADMAYH